jgi:hypothetical protein
MQLNAKSGGFMRAMRRILGILVMIAGVLGLVLSLAGLVTVWAVKPTLSGFLGSTFTTLNENITSSQQVIQITGQALGATVDSVDTLSSMLGTTATSVEDTKPLIAQLNSIFDETLPSAISSATDSLDAAQQAAIVLDSTIKSLENFRTLISSVPMLGALVDQPVQSYNPQTPMADSFGELATNLADLPESFTEMSTDLQTAGDNLTIIQSNLSSMSESVGRISSSLSDYQNMVAQSQSSMEKLKTTLTSIQSSFTTILNWVTIVLTLFFLWLLAAQVVILSQGLELYRGTADRMEGVPEPKTAKAATVENLPPEPVEKE